MGIAREYLSLRKTICITHAHLIDAICLLFLQTFPLMSAQAFLIYVNDLNLKASCFHPLQPIFQEDVDIFTSSAAEQRLQLHPEILRNASKFLVTLVSEGQMKSANQKTHVQMNQPGRGRCVSTLGYPKKLTPWLMEPGGSMPHSEGLSNNQRQVIIQTNI